MIDVMSSIVRCRSKAVWMSRTVEASFLIFWTARSIAMYSTTAGTTLEPRTSERDHDQTDEDEPDQAHAALPISRSHIHLPLSFQEFSNITSS